MKTLIVFLVAVFLAGNSLVAQRYIDEVFTDVVTVKNQLYSVNLTIIDYPNIRPDSLCFDLYMPAGDTETGRPLAVVLHNGSFLPRGWFAPTGDKDDYANAEICTRLAKRGYVAASIQYRKGWNPVSPDELERRSTIIQATYRSIQDLYTFLRFMNMTASDGNPFGVCMDKVSLFGLGTGAITAINAAALNSAADIDIPKYMYNGVPFIDTTFLGNLHGTTPGAINIPNHVGHKDDFHFAFGFDGVLGDISWLDEHDNIPIAAIGVVSHPLTPFGYNPVNMSIDPELYVYGPVGPVVPVAGSIAFIQKANDLCLNAELVASRYDDPVSQAARLNIFASQEENIFPVNLPGFQTGPWEYWDSTFWDMIPGQCGLGSIDDCAKLTNPDMSLEKANAYIDTAMQMFLPRAYSALNLDVDACENTFSCEGVEPDELMMDDFECNRRAANKYAIGGDRLCVIDNPQKDSDNPSSVVGAYRDPANDPWAPLCIEFGKPIQFDLKSPVFHFKINAPVEGPFLVKFEGGTTQDYQEWFPISSPGAWEDIAVDVSPLIGTDHTRICLFPNGGVTHETDDVYLIDDLNGLLIARLFTPDVDPLEISPNPVSHTLYIMNPGKAEKFRMVNALGQFVTEFTAAPGERFVTLPVDDLHVGVYLLGAYDNQGKLIGNARIMKQ